MISIPIQLIVQFYFQVHANRKFIENDLGALHWAVWLVYASYTLLNVSYSFPYFQQNSGTISCHLNALIYIVMVNTE